MSIHIHIYGGNGLFPRSKTIVVGEHPSEMRKALQRLIDARRSREITDRGGIDCTVRPSDRIGP